MGKAFGYRRWFLVLAVAACGVSEVDRHIANFLDRWIFDFVPIVSPYVFLYVFAVLRGLHGGVLVAGGTVVTLDCVFSSRVFLIRWGEYCGWISAALMVAFVTGTFNQYPNHEHLFLLVPTVGLVSQTPFWGFAYFRNWRLQREEKDANPTQIWSLRDWLFGSVVASISLALMRQGFNIAPAGDEMDYWGFLFGFCFTVSTSAILIAFPATWYVLRPTNRNAWKIGVLFHITTIGVLIGLSAAIADIPLLSVNKWQAAIVMTISSAFLILTTVSGLATFRLDGYRLVAGRKPSGRGQATDSPQSTVD